MENLKIEEKVIYKLLDSKGEERLEQKKERMRNLLKIARPDEALYREIMLALGYKNNKVQFLELAMILPYSRIVELRTHQRIKKPFYTVQVLQPQKMHYRTTSISL